MKPRVFLVHAYGASMPPIATALASGLPRAEIVNLLDESLYADVGEDGFIPDGIYGRMESLLRHCALSGAAAIVFTGATFSAAVDHAAKTVSVPVIKSDQALAQAAAADGRRIALMCTARRALPVLERAIRQEAELQGRTVALDLIWVAGAKDALVAGDSDAHDRLIAQAIMQAVATPGIAVLGQASMMPALRHCPEAKDRVLTPASAIIARLQEILGIHPGGPA